MKIDNIVELIEKELYIETDPFNKIGSFHDENNDGITSFYSSNMISDEAKFIN